VAETRADGGCIPEAKGRIMAQKNDVPVIGYRALIIMHVILIAFMGLVSYVDYTLPD